ncbi:hypothetical protein CDG60_17885 [Acinetobacter chinensis]|uniref:Uncharacterized protein n=1 Tax=Acinetobacter chinensis TaxID=2004650 RepID=A0A3B7M6G5_9GAMM|nr:hypothetical protein CDG60_17885 [Acinetobacter chinensis]
MQCTQFRTLSFLEAVWSEALKNSVKNAGSVYFSTFNRAFNGAKIDNFQIKPSLVLTGILYFLTYCLISIKIRELKFTEKNTRERLIFIWKITDIFYQNDFLYPGGMTVCLSGFGQKSGRNSLYVEIKSHNWR